MSRVSVVVPTFKRLQSVQAAVRSVLNQTRPADEIFVVNDGPDPEKREAFAQPEWRGVTFVEAPRRGLPAATRNHGIRLATGDFVALLDDDDVWLPRKLELQLAAAARIDQLGILGARERVFDRYGRFWSRPLTIVAGADSDELLFVHESPHTSTILAPRELFLRFPFREDIPSFEDWEWFLHAGRAAGVVILEDTVAERPYSQAHDRVTVGGRFELARDWYRNNRHLLSPRARAHFVCKILARKAAFDRKPGALPELLGELRKARHGGGRLVIRFFLPWLVPTRIRGLLKSRIQGSAR